jgi:hypothetical protein
MNIGTKVTKQNWKLKIVAVVINGSLFAAAMCLVDYSMDGKFKSLLNYVLQGVFFGIFMGIGFPYLMEKFGGRFASKLGKNIKPELTEDELVEIEGPANLFRGMEGVGGKLFLTNKKVIFKSHKINIQKGQTNIDYNDITEIRKRTTAKLIDNGISIKTNTGKEFDFVVNDRDRWIEELNARMN